MPITYCTVYGQLVEVSGRVLVNAPVNVRPVAPAKTALWNTDGEAIDPRGITVLTGADGSFSVSLVPSANTVPSGVQYVLTGPYGFSLLFRIPSEAAYNPVNGSTATKPVTFGVPNTCIVSGRIADMSGSLLAGRVLSWGLYGWDDALVSTASGGIVVPHSVETITDGQGIFLSPLLPSNALIPSGTVKAWIRGPDDLNARFVVPSQAGVLLADLL